MAKNYWVWLKAYLSYVMFIRPSCSFTNMTTDRMTGEFPHQLFIAASSAVTCWCWLKLGHCLASGKQLIQFLNTMHVFWRKIHRSSLQRKSWIITLTCSALTTPRFKDKNNMFLRKNRDQVFFRAKICHVVSRGSAVQSAALLPISAMRLWASSDKEPRVSTATGKKHVSGGVRTVGYLVDFLADAAAAALPACRAFCDT